MSGNETNLCFLPPMAAQEGTAQRFLLIKAYGAGFWCDIDHVIGGLLIAEMAGRIPVIYWGKNSIYGGSEEQNAFEQFFMPVSAYSIYDLIRDNYTVCPEMWNVHNLLAEESPQLIRAWRYPLDVMLARSENILVVGWAPLYQVQPWLQQPHPAAGLNPESVYRYVFEKYLRLQPHIMRKIDEFYYACLAHRQILAVHVRGSDKVTEVANIRQINKLYEAEIQKYLARNPVADIFLLTESREILDKYKCLFREKLIYTDCQRTGNDDPIFFRAETDKVRMGVEVLTDVWLALRCDAFIGNAHSNVSNAIVRLKQWPVNSLKLFSVNDLHYG